MIPHPIQPPTVPRPVAAAVGYRALPGPVPRAYFHASPAGIHPGTPILVTVHGISMNAAEHLMRMRAVADEAGAIVIAPCFDRHAYRGYQRLGSSGRGSKAPTKTASRADLALIDILADVRHRAGLDPAPVYLTGFSGGAQFAHRFALYHADLVAACVSCAAGWYTMPDETTAFPLGLAPGSGPDGLSPHPRWREVPHHVLVGRRDNQADDALNMDPPVVERQGTGRRTRARRWVKEMNAGRPADQPQVTLTELDGLAHDYTKAHEHHDLARLIAVRLGLLAPVDTSLEIAA